MVDFETAIQDAVATQEIPGCAVAATSRDGNRSLLFKLLVYLFFNKQQAHLPTRKPSAPRPWTLLAPNLSISIP